MKIQLWWMWFVTIILFISVVLAAIKKIGDFFGLINWISTHRYYPIMKLIKEGWHKLWFKHTGMIPLKSSPLSILEVKNLEDITKRVPFVENPAIGKFIDKEEKTWRDLKEEVDFSKFQFIDLSSWHKIFFITGEPGIGKSTYMLWNLDNLLQKKTFGIFHKKQFSKIVFLNPNPEGWAEELSEYNPQKTLLVIDALRRESDNTNDFKSRCSHLFRLAFEGVEIDGRRVGPFKVLATIRKDEYDNILSKIRIPHAPVCECPVESANLDFEKILRKYLDSYNDSYKLPKERKEEIIQKLILKSKGLPVYIRYLFTKLKEAKKGFSEEILEECPVGIVNLIWQIIKSRYYIEDDDAIPFLLLLLSRTDKYFSGFFLDSIAKELAGEKIKEDVRNKIIGLKKSYLQSPRRATRFIDTKVFALSSHWKDSIKRGIEQPSHIDQGYQDVAVSYQTVSDENFNRLLNKLIEGLKERLKGGFQDNADPFLCVDLAKLGEEHLDTATEIYIKFYSSSKLPSNYISALQEELYELWISKAWEYRSFHQDEKVVSCYKNAFDKLGVRTHRKQLSAYASFITKYVLPKFKDCSHEFTEWVKKTESLYKEVIDLDPTDKISWQTFALFYQKLGKYQEADGCFKKALQIDYRYVITLQAYARFWQERGDKLQAINREEANKYYQLAEDFFKQSLDNARKQNFSLPPALNAYAIFKQTQALYQKENEKKFLLEAYQLYKEALQADPLHIQTLVRFPEFCGKVGAKIFPDYKSGLDEAKQFIVQALKQPLNPMDTFKFKNVLGILLYKYNAPPDYPNYPESERLLLESSESPDSLHNAISYHELAMLYAKQNKKDEANDYFQKAISIPESRHSIKHLMIVYKNYASFLSTQDDKKCVDYERKYKEYAGKMDIKIAEDDAYLRNISYGNIEYDVGHYNTAISYYKLAAEAPDIDQSENFPLWRISQCYKQSGNHSEAVEYIVKSARKEDTSQGYGTALRELKDLDRWKKFDLTPIWLEFSRKAIELSPENPKNYSDYGEGFKEEGYSFKEKGDSVKAKQSFQNAIEQFQTSIQKYISLGIPEKECEFNYWNIGICYRELRNYEEAIKYMKKSAEIQNSLKGFEELEKNAKRMRYLEIESWAKSKIESLRRGEPPSKTVA